MKETTENILKLRREAEENGTLKNNIYLKNQINSIVRENLNILIQELKKDNQLQIVHRKK